MKVLSLILIVIFSVQTEAKVKDSIKRLEIQHVIEAIQPYVKKNVKKALINTLFKLEKEDKKDWRMYLAILHQESSLQLDPRIRGKRCLPKLQCLDVGLGQVSMYFWSKKLKIHKKRALTDPKYSLSLSLQVYNRYYKKYAKRDKKWYSRYHSGTPSKRKAYEKRIFKHYDKIVIAQKQFRRLLLDVKQEEYRCIKRYY